ncbi:MAG: hypothetical protein ACI9IL_000571 [Rickettsiales bacterium]|jgi:hypothetical protein
MFGTVISIFQKLPIPALILFGGFIPTFFLILTALFIMMYFSIICPTTILNLLFQDSSSYGYDMSYNFIMSGKEFFEHFIDKMFKIIKITFDSLLGEDNFLNSPISGEESCPTPTSPAETLPDTESNDPAHL